MRLTFVLTLFAGTVLPAQAADSDSMTQYSDAVKAAQKAGKGLAVFFTPVKADKSQVSKEAPQVVDAATMKLLKKSYLTLHIDTSTPSGKRLAKKFEMGDVGVVLSDKSVEKQAFRHQGEFTSALVREELTRLQAPARTRYSQPTYRGYGSPSYYPSRSYYGGFGGYGGGFGGYSGGGCSS